MDWNALVPILLTTAITLMTLVGRAWKHQSDAKLQKLREDREEDKRRADERRQEIAETFAYQKEILERLDARNKALSAEIEILSKSHAEDFKEMERLRDENVVLQNKMRQIESENVALKKQVETLSRQLKAATGGNNPAQRRRRN